MADSRIVGRQAKAHAVVIGSSCVGNSREMGQSQKGNNEAAEQSLEHRLSGC